MVFVSLSICLSFLNMLCSVYQEERYERGQLVWCLCVTTPELSQWAPSWAHWLHICTSGAMRLKKKNPQRVEKESVCQTHTLLSGFDLPVLQQPASCHRSSKSHHYYLYVNSLPCFPLFSLQGRRQLLFFAFWEENKACKTRWRNN